MSIWWNTPFLVSIGLSMLILVVRPTLSPLEKLCAFFGIGSVDASVAQALVFGCAGLFGLVFNIAVARVWAGAYAPEHFAVGLASGLGLGLGVAWLAGRLADDPGGEL